MKALFVCLTDYQLLNSINIKVNLLKDCKADIIIFNNKKGNVELADRLQSTGIFENVYVYSEFFTGLHKYLRGITENKKEIGFLKAVNGTVKNICLKVLSLVKNNETIIQYKIHNNKALDFSKYNQFFGIGTKSFVNECYKAILKYNKCSNNVIDEGLATYLTDEWSKNYPIDKLYVYEPEMLVYKNNNLVKIPKINTNNKDFVRLINFVFDFNDSDKIDLKDKIIFFDQNTDPMPKYLKNAGRIKKFIFANPYKKHLKEQVVYKTKMDLFKILVKTFNNENIFVKIHPRSNSDYIEDYKKEKAEFLPNVLVPWEVFGCNCKIENNIWITMYSSALFSYTFTIENAKKNNKYIFLYRILNDRKKMKRFDVVDKFFSKFQEQYPDKIFIPNNINEFFYLLTLIKGDRK